MREKIVAGNWKMNKSFQEAEELLSDINDLLSDLEDKEAKVILCPPLVFLELAIDMSYEEQFVVGAQNVSEFGNGAYTGEVSATMLRSMDIPYCIVGHSERRKYFHETDEMIKNKVDQLIKSNLSPIFCCGELLSEREAHQHVDVVRQQLKKSLFHLPADEFRKVIIAYEPVWAIGTGVNATPSQAQEMHAAIRELIQKQYKKEIAEGTTILYGGSCNAANAGELFANPDVDGGLIGGASLKANEFVSIVTSLK
ncbi:MAG: triose-phosphate isomerase [Bacteroidales bacterium]|nr:triose-phosphate isomerase [Lentimicrobiaceae bacterium]MDD5696101.1 triose-phosphate isomerase [Bacteroidales bacterium]